MLRHLLELLRQIVPSECTHRDNDAYYNNQSQHQSWVSAHKHKHVFLYVVMKSIHPALMSDLLSQHN